MSYRCFSLVYFGTNNPHIKHVLIRSTVVVYKVDAILGVRNIFTLLWGWQVWAGMSETHFALSLVLGGGPRFVRGFSPSLNVGITTQSVLLVPHFGSHCVHFKYTSVCSLVLFCCFLFWRLWEEEELHFILLLSDDTKTWNNVTECKRSWECNQKSKGNDKNKERK